MAIVDPLPHTNSTGVLVYGGDCDHYPLHAGVLVVLAV